MGRADDINGLENQKTSDIVDFNTSKPIYRQITDYCYGRILSSDWQTDGRVPSVKELSVAMAVNTRTVLKSYDDMQALGILYQKRGLGCFVSSEAKDIIRDQLREEFFADTLPRLRHEMSMLGISVDELVRHLND